MDIILIAILMAFMLLVITLGAVAWCYAAWKKASRAEAKACALSDALLSSEKRLDDMEEQILKLREKALESAPESPRDEVMDELDRKRESQYEELMRAKPPKLLNLGGDA